MSEPNFTGRGAHRAYLGLPARPLESEVGRTQCRLSQVSPRNQSRGPTPRPATQSRSLQWLSFRSVVVVPADWQSLLHWVWRGRYDIKVTPTSFLSID